ncbi:MAG: hypothetical protein U0941_20855 [Planctomycetaceae bacterium]
MRYNVTIQDSSGNTKDLMYDTYDKTAIWRSVSENFPGWWIQSIENDATYDLIKSFAGILTNAYIVPKAYRSPMGSILVGRIAAELYDHFQHPESTDLDSLAQSAAAILGFERKPRER